jgi:diadenosine tetraphosphate (Ap4A) HIT family hydrolase
MHWHIIARYDTDKAWPNPVWGFQSPQYENSQENHIITLFQNALLNKN